MSNLPPVIEPFVIELKPTGPPHPPAGPTPTPAPEPAPLPTSFVKMGWVRQTNDLTDEQCQRIVDALNLQVMHDLERLWPHVQSGNVWHYYAGTDPKAVAADDWPGYWLTDSDQAGALGYHDTDPQGRPYSRVFTGPTLQNGGTVMEGSNSVSVTTSHEACEQAVDPSCTLTFTDSENSEVWAGEVGDPVESSSYDITLPDGTVVAVSDFVGPAFFDAAPGDTFDVLGVVLGPFELAPGGYAIINGQAEFDREFPQWKRATKRAEAARTHRRGVQL